MDWLYENFVAGKQKAVVAFVVTALVAWLVKHGVELPEDASDTLQALAWGLVGLVSVYLKRNQ
jgi:uncharacterized membrane protein (DUF441 family)